VPKPAFLLILFLTLLFTHCGNIETVNSGELPAEIPHSSSLQGKHLTPQDSLINLLYSMKSTSLDCTADIYWKIVQGGAPYIPYLIDHLTDMGVTKIYNDCKKGNLTVGELCYFALEEIVDIPVYLITRVEFDLIVNNCWNFYDYFFDNKNKNSYQNMVRIFFNLHQSTGFAFVNYKKEELKPCHNLYHISGKLKWIGNT